MKDNTLLKDQELYKLVRRLRYLSSLKPKPDLPNHIPEETCQERIELWNVNNSPADESESDVDSGIIPPTEVTETKNGYKRRYWNPKYEKLILQECASIFKKGMTLRHTHQIKEIIWKSQDKAFQMLVLSFGENATQRIYN